MRCDAYLANAERILRNANDNPDQCASRAIAHAAYYAVMHFVADKLGLSVTGTNAAKHADLRRAISAYNGPDVGLREAKLHFATLQSYRTDSDYHLSKQITAIEAKRSVKRASDVFRAAGITPAVI